MPGFTDEDELRRYVGGIFEEAMADPALAPELAATGLVFRLACTEPDCAITVDLPGGAVYRGSEGPEPAATLHMSSATANEYWQGTVNLTFAMARKKITVDGSLGKLIALAPLSKKLFPVYRERLAADGRTDLLVEVAAPRAQ